MNYVRELELRYRPGRWMRIGPDGPFNGPATVHQALSAISRLPREVFIVIHLDAMNRPLGYDVASVGCANAALVIPKDVVRPLLYSGADGCILVQSSERKIRAEPGGHSDDAQAPRGS